MITHACKRRTWRDEAACQAEWKCFAKIVWLGNAWKLRRDSYLENIVILNSTSNVPEYVRTRQVPNRSPTMTSSPDSRSVEIHAIRSHKMCANKARGGETANVGLARGWWWLGKKSGRQKTRVHGPRSLSPHAMHSRNRDDKLSDRKRRIPPTDHMGPNPDVEDRCSVHKISGRSLPR